MKEIPILFSTEMVRAIIAGRKTETRRVAVPVKDDSFDGGFKFGHGYSWTSINYPKIANNSKYGTSGDVLWVREEHYRFGHWEKDNTKKRKTGRQAWKFVADNEEIKYADNAPEDFRKGRHHHDSHTPAWHKRLARFMPKAAARIWLQVEEIRVERLKDITEASAIAEGIEISKNGLWRNYIHPEVPRLSAIDSFMTLIGSIITMDKVFKNPWVWVVKFKVLSTTGKPSNI